MAKKKKFYKPYEEPKPLTAEEIQALFRYETKERFFHYALPELKADVKKFIQKAEYTDAGELATHILECHKGSYLSKFEISRECLKELIEHWRID